VIATADGDSEIVARDMRTLLPDHPQLADAFNAVLESLAGG
jgi:hypothetical protein